MIYPAYEIVIAGRTEAEDTQRMLYALREHFLPNAVVLLRSPDDESSDIASIAPFTQDLKPLDE